MRNILRSSFFLLIFFVTAFCGGKVEDTTQSSAKIGDILTNPDNVDKLDAIMSGLAQSYAIGKYAVQNGGIKASMNEMKPDMDKLKKGLAVKYKNSKGGQGFYNFIYTTQEFLMDILNTAGDRIDMWRTTLPTIKEWGKSTLRLADATRQVYQDFRWKDLIDIDRKWSRRMEKVNMKWIGQYYGFLNYLWGIGSDTSIERRLRRWQGYIYTWQLDSAKTAGIEYQKLKDIKAIIDSKEFNAMEELTPEGRAYLFRRLPIHTMETAIIGLSNAQDIILGDQESTAKGQSKEDLEYELQQRVSDANMTYLGSVALLATIKRLRTDVEAQRTTLNQIQSNLSHTYARVQMMEIEEKAVSQSNGTNELQKIVLGKWEIPRDTTSWRSNRPN